MTSPIAAQSSLSHCSTLRPGVRPHSTGHTSITGRSHRTIPAEWIPRWRGRWSTSIAIVATSGGMGAGAPGSGAAVAAAEPTAARSAPAPQPRSTDPAHRSDSSTVAPSARAMSRTAERGR